MAFQPTSPTHSVDDSEDDPVVATYNVFLKPALPENQRIILTRTFHKKPNSAATAEGGAKPPPPTELRIKPKTGILELDVPLDLMTSSYDRAKGLKWGVAVANSPLLKAGGSHGLAGGFGIGGPPQKVSARRGAHAAALVEEESQYLDFAEAARQDKVLRHLTLGGECHPPADGAMEAYIGVFHGG